MSGGYVLAGWAGFGGAVATAAAALAGLLFIAVSINLAKILAFPSLPGRTGMTLILLALPLAIGLVLLIPGQSALALGLELVAAALVTGAVLLVIDFRTVHGEQEKRLTWVTGRFTPTVVSCGCLLVAGVTLAASAGGGLYWVVPAVIVAFGSGLGNVWVLLIEIQR